LFRKEGAFIVNERSKVMDVAGAQDRENQNIQINTKHGRVNQLFDIIYEDEWKEEPVKGELNKKFGLYVERPFYIVSQLS